MNNDGKINILFVLIPVFLIITLILVDTLISFSENKTFRVITEDIIKSTLEDDNIDSSEYLNEIKRKYSEKNYDTEMLVVNEEGKGIYLENENKYFGLLSSLKTSKSKKEKVDIFGITFNLRKNSKSIIKVKAYYDYDDNLKFDYVK